LAAAVAIQTVAIAYFLALHQRAVEKADRLHKETLAVRAAVLVTVAVILLVAVELQVKELRAA
jgi:hypothetical protein